MDLLIEFLATILIILMTFTAVYLFRKKFYLYLLLGLAGYGFQKAIITLIKIFIHTERPFIALNKTPLVIFPPHDYSFPSGHACFAFFIATMIYLKNKKTGIIFYFLASLVGIGRVLANVHYPIDILGGAILGITIGLGINQLLKLFSPIDN